MFFTFELCTKRTWHLLVISARKKEISEMVLCVMFYHMLLLDDCVLLRSCTNPSDGEREREREITEREREWSEWKREIELGSKISETCWHHTINYGVHFKPYTRNIFVVIIRFIVLPTPSQKPRWGIVSLERIASSNIHLHYVTNEWCERVIFPETQVNTTSNEEANIIMRNYFHLQ